jgi:SnoaL-like domain
MQLVINKTMRLTILFPIIFLMNCSSETVEIINGKDFAEIITNIAKGWNEGNAAFAAQYFADSAVYEEPPGKQLYKGRKEIFEFFGGDDGFDKPMKMEWHNLAFNEEKQLGFGEYTFAMNSQYHGIVIMKFENGKIVKWREYQYKSNLRWDDFAEESKFKTME